MPCYEVRTVQVEFKAGSREYLLKALEQTGIEHTWNKETNIIYGGGNYGKLWAINLDKQTATVEQGYEAELNKVRRAYSEAVVNEVARKKKWLVKKAAENKIQLKRY
jgi:hypothetical protein